MLSDNRSLAKGYVSALASGWHGSHYVDPDDHKVVIDTYNLTHTTAGLFTGAQHLDFQLDAEVGEEMSFSLTVDADTLGEVSAYSPGPSDPIENAVGQACSTVAVAFGASAISAPAAAGGEAGAEEIELISQRMGGVFPSAALATALAAEAAMPANPYLHGPGDADGDGCVDGADYTAWADHYGQTGVPKYSQGGWTVGNWDEITIVDGADYTAWADNYQSGCGAAVPEPAVAMLLAAAAAWGALRRRPKA
jgi:hypothetical protein